MLSQGLIIEWETHALIDDCKLLCDTEGLETMARKEGLVALVVKLNPDAKVMSAEPLHPAFTAFISSGAFVRWKPSAYDEKRVQSWADPNTGLAPEYWCRAIGWFGMATVQILDVIPANHPRRAALVDIVRNLVRGFATYQDPATGRWFQVVDKGSRSDNWTETSCSAMYTFTIQSAVDRGYTDRRFAANAALGYRGVLDKISLNAQGLTDLTDISVGTNVGDLAYYLARERSTNDLHGQGAFLIMNELMRGRAG